MCKKQLFHVDFHFTIQGWGRGVGGGNKGRRKGQGRSREEESRQLQEKKIKGRPHFFSNVLYKNNKRASIFFFIFIMFYQTPILVIISIFYFSIK